MVSVQEMGGRIITSSVVEDTTLVVNGLTPDTDYVFSIAAVNSAGIGPYNATSFSTLPSVTGIRS